MPGAYLWLDPEIEERLLGEVEQRRITQQAAQQSVTPEQADLASSLSESYPWLDPGVIQSMTLAGFGPNSALALQIGDTGGRVTLQEGGFDDAASSTPDGFLDALWGGIVGFRGSGLDLLGKGLQQGLRGGIALLSAPVEEVFERFIPSLMEAELATRPEAGPTTEGLKLMIAGHGVQLLVGPGSGREGFWERFWTNYREKASPSTLALAIGDFQDPNRSPAFFGFGEDEGLIANFERRQRLRSRLKVPGQDPVGTGVLGGDPAGDPSIVAYTFGRGIAVNFLEPGTKPYQLVSGLFDFSANLLPVGLGTGKVQKGARQAVGLLSDKEIIELGGEVGLLPGIRKVIDPQISIDRLLNKPQGQELVRVLTKESSPSKIYQATGKTDIKLAHTLAENIDPGETQRILSLAIGGTTQFGGVGIRNFPTAGPLGRLVGTPFGELSAVFGPGFAASRATRNIRMLGEVPKRIMNPHNLDEAARNLFNYVRGAKLGDDVLDKYLVRLANIPRGDNAALTQLSLSLAEDVVIKLMNQSGFLIKPLTRNQAENMTRLFRLTDNDLRGFFINQFGVNADVLGAKSIIVEGVKIPMPTPHILAELANQLTPLPGLPRDLKKATSFLARVWDIQIAGRLPLRDIEWFADEALSKLWKPFQLITRIAYPVRVIFEGQARLAATGMETLFNHPASYIQWVMASPQGRVSQFLTDVAKQVGVKPKGLIGPAGKAADDFIFDAGQTYQAALVRGSAGWRGIPGYQTSGRFPRVTKGEPEFFQAASRELGIMSADPVMIRVAGGLQPKDLRSIGMDLDDPAFDTIEALKQWYWEGTGKKFRLQLSEVDRKGKLRTDRAVADREIDTFVERVRIKTGGDPDLVNAIATGKLGKINLRKLPQQRPGRTRGKRRADTGLAKELENYEDVLPEFMLGEEFLDGDVGWWDSFVETMFHTLMSAPENTLNRSPFYLQQRWKDAERLMGFATPKVQRKVIENARKANLGSAAEARLAKIAVNTSSDKIQSVEEFDMIVRAYALQETKDVLYDLSRRSQFFDAARHIFPFGDAFKEIFSAWVKITKQNPAVLRRFQQGVQGALGPGFGELTSDFLGTGLQPGQGFFYEDPLTQKMMFTYPGSELISNWMFGNDTGAQVDFTGFVTGLNLFAATILPGIGPSITAPVQIFTEAFNIRLPEAIDNILFPFGRIALEEGPIEEILLPAWAKKVRIAILADPESNRLYINTTHDVMRVLVRTGTHSTDSPEELNRLIRDAQDMAHTLLLIRGFAQSIMPTGPSVRWKQADLDGNLHPTSEMAQVFRELVDKYDGDDTKAMTEWLRLFGTKNLLVLQGKSREIIKRPLNEEGDQWIQARPDLEEDYPLVIGLFAPDPVGAEFDFTAFNRTFVEGTRERLKPQQALELSNNYIATLIWEQAKDTMAGRTDPQARDYLEDVREQLIEQYPGFKTSIQILNRPDIETQIRQLELAIVDPELSDTDTAQGSAIYFEARAAAQLVVEQEVAKGSLPSSTRSYKTSAGTLFIRDWLRIIADEIKGEYPDFAQVWKFVFERELTNDD